MADNRIKNHEYHDHLGQDDHHQQKFHVPNLTLSLNLKPNSSQLGIDASASPASAYNKQLFGCRNCSRVFFSSQALGGHMNAHRKETKAVLKNCNYKNKQPAAAPFPVSRPSLHTLGLVGSHALSGLEPSRDKAGFEHLTRGDESEFRVPNLHEHIPPNVTNWPGSFRSADQQYYSPVDDDSEELDLNLRL